MDHSDKVQTACLPNQKDTMTTSAQEKAQTAEHALRNHDWHVNNQGEPIEDRITDLVVNLHHLADEESVDWDLILSRDILHHDEESEDR